MRDGIKTLLKKHFSHDIAERFVLTFEADKIHRLQSADIFNQQKAGVYCLEVHYKESESQMEYICDVWTNWTKKQVELQLLRMITDAFSGGRIGKNWEEKAGKLRINNLIKDKTYETPNN